MAKLRVLKNDWTFRTPLRTIEFPKGQSVFDTESLAAAEAADMLEELEDASTGPAKGSTARSTINLKG